MFDSLMRPASRLVVLALLALGPSAAHAAESGLRERMGETTFEAAGLSKLSAEELAALEAWLGGHVEEVKETALNEAIPSGELSFGLEQLAARVGGFFRDTPEVLESRIVGDFKGWSGKTVFRLENGQVWEQAAAGRFYHRAENPRVLIRKGAMGTYLLQLEGMGSTIRVRRIE